MEILEEIPFHEFVVKVERRTDELNNEFLNYQLWEKGKEIGHLFGETYKGTFQIINFYPEGEHSKLRKTKIVEALREVAEANLHKRGIKEIFIHTNATMEHHLGKRGYEKKPTNELRKPLPGKPVKSIFRRR